MKVFEELPELNQEAPRPTYLEPPSGRPNQ